MSTYRPITQTTSLLVAVRNTLVKGLGLCASAAAATLELFDGVIAAVATQTVVNAGTLYLVGDLLTLTHSGDAGDSAVFQVASVDAPETGVITGVTLVSAGSGYRAGVTYATTTNSVAGSAATISVDTVTDAGTMILKLAAVANESAPPVELDCGILSQNGLSVRITGTNAKGHLYHD